jgi:hypothetical protein
MSEWPEQPADWLTWVNERQTANELAELRESARVAAPSAAWPGRRKPRRDSGFRALSGIRAGRRTRQSRRKARQPPTKTVDLKRCASPFLIPPFSDPFSDHT